MLAEFLFPARSPVEVHTVPVALHYESAKQLRARGVHSVDAFYAATSYHHSTVRRLIQLFKYRRFSYLHEPLAACLVKASFPQVHHAVLCPVPLHWSRKFWRGFNQSEVLAQAISSHYQLPVHLLLKRKQPTGHQAHRTREQRIHRMKNMFTVSQKIDVETVILFDDVVTTGATVDACAAALKSAGVQKVIVWSLAWD